MTTPMHRGAPIAIRPYQPADDEAVGMLHDRTPPAGSHASGLQPRPADLGRITETYLGFWLATATDNGGEQVVGMVGVTAAGREIPPSVLREREGIVQLRRMRVAPERQRQGIGTLLTRTVIGWSRAHGFRTLVLETTLEQEAAITLYRRLGFAEIGRSKIGAFDLIWFELPLDAAP